MADTKARGDRLHKMIKYWSASHLLLISAKTSHCWPNVHPVMPPGLLPSMNYTVTLKHTTCVFTPFQLTDYGELIIHQRHTQHSTIWYSPPPYTVPLSHIPVWHKMCINMPKESSKDVDNRCAFSLLVSNYDHCHFVHEVTQDVWSKLIHKCSI